MLLILWKLNYILYSQGSYICWNTLLFFCRLIIYPDNQHGLSDKVETEGMNKRNKFNIHSHLLFRL